MNVREYDPDRIYHLADFHAHPDRSLPRANGEPRPVRLRVDRERQVSWEPSLVEDNGNSAAVILWLAVALAGLGIVILAALGGSWLAAWLGIIAGAAVAGRAIARRFR